MYPINSTGGLYLPGWWSLSESAISAIFFLWRHDNSSYYSFNPAKIGSTAKIWRIFIMNREIFFNMKYIYWLKDTFPVLIREYILKDKDKGQN